MNPFTSRNPSQNWTIPVTGMSLILGFMVATAWVTDSNRMTRYKFLSGDQKQRASTAEVDLEQFEKLQEEVSSLRTKSTKLENALANQDKGSKALNDQLQEYKSIACLTEGQGPGVLVTLRDAPTAGPTGGVNSLVNPELIIHDTDIQKVTNELYASGAEAISVNNLRLCATSSIRCVGPTVQVDGVRIAAPILVRAVGDKDTLYNGINLNGGVLSELRSANPAMVSVERVNLLTMPAYGGSTARKWLQSVKEKK